MCSVRSSAASRPSCSWMRRNTSAFSPTKYDSSGSAAPRGGPPVVAERRCTTATPRHWQSASVRSPRVHRGQFVRPAGRHEHGDPALHVIPDLAEALRQFGDGLLNDRRRTGSQRQHIGPQRANAPLDGGRRCQPVKERKDLAHRLPTFVPCATQPYYDHARAAIIREFHSVEDASAQTLRNSHRSRPKDPRGWSFAGRASCPLTRREARSMLYMLVHPARAPVGACEGKMPSPPRSQPRLRAKSRPCGAIAWVARIDRAMLRAVTASAPAKRRTPKA